MWPPNGGAKYYKRCSFARLPGEGFLFCEEKEPKVTRGGPRDPRRVGTPRIIGAPARSQDLVGKGGCTAAGRAARSKAQGQPDLSEGCVRRDDAYKVFILIWFLLNPT